MIEDDDETEKQTEADFDNERPVLKTRLGQAALSIEDDMNNFCETLGDADLVSALNLVGLKRLSSKMFPRKIN